MKSLNKSASAVLNILTADLAVGGSRKIDNTDGAFMPVSVDRIAPSFYAVAHNYSQGGDLIADPDMVFTKTPAGEWLPVTYQDGFGYKRAIEYDDGFPVRWSPRLYADLRSFATTWMKNIKAQQGLKAPRKPRTRREPTHAERAKTIEKYQPVA